MLPLGSQACLLLEVYKLLFFLANYAFARRRFRQVHNLSENVGECRGQ